MILQVKAYHNRDGRYTTESITRIVGCATVEVDVNVEEPTRRTAVCEAVFELMNGRTTSTVWGRMLTDVARRYRAENMRSMRPGDLITVWTAESMDYCAVERVYEVREFGFERVNRERASV